MKAYYFCSNCGKNGHLFHQCKQPITSIGILTFRYNKGIPEFLMICRKDTLGYVDFVRGKYLLYNKTYLLNILSVMTKEEHNNLLTQDFDTLWKNLWGEHIGIQYRGEETTSADKFEILKEGINGEYNLQSLIEEVNVSWTEPEWGFPKGRRNYQEKDLQCALREMEEETGYQRYQMKVVQNVIPLEEIFIGSNYKSYKHRYYLAYLDNNVKPQYAFQKTEVSKMVWKGLDAALNLIRPYNLEKRELLQRVNKLLLEYRLYE
jgi:8-oxo-dGTP pyrophosphatase MutT (NUDIX family)